MNDKRSYHRQQTFLPIKFQFQEKKQEPDGYVTNISLQGLQLLVSHRLVENDNITFTVLLADKNSEISLTGKIVRVSRIDDNLWHIGIDLQEINPDTMKIMINELAKKAAKSPKIPLG